MKYEIKIKHRKKEGNRLRRKGDRSCQIVFTKLSGLDDRIRYFLYLDKA